MPHCRIDFDAFPRTRLCHQPTPIEHLPRLTRHLGGPNLFIKRDDCTGLATGGNKTRKLEFLVGEALQQNADTLVTQGAVQSNHVRQTAAAASKSGMKCHVLLERRVPGRDASYEETGNVLLNQLFGATHEFRPDGLDMNAEAKAVSDSLRDRGSNPYFIPGGGSNEIGALGYSVCAQEIADYSSNGGEAFDWLVMGTGSTGTQAGLVAGFHAIGHNLPVMGVSVRQPQERQINAVHALTQKTIEKLSSTENNTSLPNLTPEGVPLDKILVDDGYVGEGYGIPAESTLEAIQLAAQQEGLLLDPVYSAKGMAGLIGMVRQGFFKDTDNVIFLHTGGASALFAYQEQLLASLN